MLEDIELYGVPIPRGAELALQFASANRDPAGFDRADELVLDRKPNPYISFGAGIHYCLGAPLAKLEMGILFREILARMPNLGLRQPPAWKPTFVLRGLESLPVSAGRGAA